MITQELAVEDEAGDTAGRRRHAQKVIPALQFDDPALDSRLRCGALKALLARNAARQVLLTRPSVDWRIIGPTHRIAWLI
jgi:hypothetical protein